MSQFNHESEDASLIYGRNAVLEALKARIKGYGGES